MSRTWHIVLGSPANRRRVLETFKACRAESEEPFGKEHEAAVSRLLVDASAGRMYIVEVDGEPAGVACVCFQQSVIWADKLAVLEKLYLLRQFQGIGLAQRFLRAIVGDLEKFGSSIVVAYLSEDDPIVRLFELEGFSASKLVRFADLSLSNGF